MRYCEHNLLASYEVTNYSKAMKILLSSYSFGANRGSEAGVGWNVASRLAQRGHEVWVLTTSEFHELNATAIRERGLEQKLHLVELDCGLSDFPVAKTYKLWQQRIAAPLSELCAKHDFDLFHHITFNQYRYLRDLFYCDLPALIGPLGGAETVHPIFRKELPRAMRIKEMLRPIPFDAIPLGARLRHRTAPVMTLCSTPQTRERLTRYASVAVDAMIPIISIDESEICAEVPERASAPYLMFDGGGRPEKGALLMIRALALLWDQGHRVPVHLAAVSEPDKLRLRDYARAYKLPDEALELLPFMPRHELLARMRGAHGFLSVGFRDAGCMALLEAIALGLPALCYDHAGQWWLPEEYAIKIPLPDRAAEQQLASAMEELLELPERDADWHQQRAQWLRETMTWDRRIDQIEYFYKDLLKKS